MKPVSYPIPDDGPVGKMLEHIARHPWRPAHVHSLVSADGYDKVITHTFVKRDPYLVSDAVFRVKDTLIAPYGRVEDGDTEWQSKYDFVLKRS